MSPSTDRSDDPLADPFAERRADFRRLHASGFFVLPNPWDIGSARYLASRGFRALATTSSGAAFSLGRPDGAMTLDETLAHIATIVGATELPVNADFEDGHAADLDGLAHHVARCVATGVAAVSIEDATGDRAAPLYAFDDALARVKAARAAIDAAPGSGGDTLLVARAECWLTGHATPLAEATKRLVAFADAGAHCLYAPGVTSLDEIAALVRAVAPKPLNVLLRTPPFPSLRALEDVGVRRVSVGGALAIAAWDGFFQATDRLLHGDGLAATAQATHGVLNAMFSAPLPGA